MGCTSSAPNMAQTRTAEKSIQFEEQFSDSSSKDVDEIIYRAANDINVLPSCDTLPEPIHLIRNKSTPSLNHDKEHPENGYVVASIIKAESSDVLHQEDKISRLEEVVDKVVQLHVKAEPVNTQPVEKATEEHPATEEKTEGHNSEESKVGATETTINQEPADIQDKEEEENPEETSSPSRSESSRATRWEALADIAAELPPSLTVDPITGQIYALSK